MCLNCWNLRASVLDDAVWCSSRGKQMIRVMLPARGSFWVTSSFQRLKAASGSFCGWSAEKQVPRLRYASLGMTSFLDLWLQMEKDRAGRAILFSGALFLFYLI
jgi:hypothetical protein